MIWGWEYQKATPSSYSVYLIGTKFTTNKLGHKI